MSPPRIVVAGATSALARRTTLRKAFLGPWHPLVEACWLYALADAQRHTGVAVHHSTLVVTHHHTSVTATRANLPEFTHRFHRDFSCALQALLADHRYDTPRELFDDRQTHQMRLLDPAAQMAHLLYERLNPVAAGLVERPEHMPLRDLGFGRWKSGFVEVERPPVYFGRSRPHVLRLALSPPPLLYQAFRGDLAALVHHMERLTREGCRALRDARRQPPMGARALRRLHPWSEPRTCREPRGQRVPTFRIGAHGDEGRTLRIRAAREVRAFRQRHRQSLNAYREGDRDALFPFGTYAMRVHHGAQTEPEPPPDAWLTLPGPLLDDLREAPHADDDLMHDLTDAVSAAIEAESAEVAEASALDFREAKPTDPPPPTAGTDAPAPTARPLAVVRHRIDPHPAPGPRRVVTLRDHRRGRPPSSLRHTADPPP